MNAANKTELAQERTEKAAERNDLAEDRTLLANERTFAGWCRTSFASIGLGLGFQALFQKVELRWVPKGVAPLFIVLGVWLIWTAERRAAGLDQSHRGNEVALASSRGFRVIAASATLGAAFLLAAIWTLI